MHLAVMGKKLENVKELVSAGADVNIAERNGKHAPLHFACMAKEIEIVKELVRAGAKIDQHDKSGKTAIDHAKNNKEIMEVLEGMEIANRQGEFLKKLTVISERTAAGVVMAKEELVDEEL